MERVLRNAFVLFLMLIAPTAWAQDAAPADNSAKPAAPAAVAAPKPEAPASTTKTAEAKSTDAKAADATPSEAKPADAKQAEKAGPPALRDDGKLTFNFRYQPWQDVLDWFADQAGLSLLIESPPPGTFNYRDSRSYTPAEALDVLNGVLLTKGYTLVRKDRMLVLVNLEDGVPPNLVPDVLLDELDKRGEYELIRVIFPVWNMTPDQAAEEVQPILGPQGKVVTLPQARQIQVTETAGRLRTIRSIVNAVEQPSEVTAGLREFKLNYVTFEAAMPTIRRMLNIPGDAYTTPDNAVQISKGAVGEKILFRGTAQNAARLAQILHLIDVPEAAAGINGAPQLEVYAVTATDPEAVVKVLQQLLKDDPNVTLAADKEGHIVAFATPPQQATIKATIDQMQKDNRDVDVITLANTDPQVAVMAINKLFGSLDDKPDPSAPRVDADLTSRNLIVRGTASQLLQIRNLLHELGESEEEGVANTASQQHVRVIPLTGAAARSAVEQIEQIWPTLRPNRIRIVAPASGIRTYNPTDTGDGSAPVQQRVPQNDSPAATAPNDLQQLFQMLQQGRADQPPTQKAPQPDGADIRTSIFRYAAESAAPPTSAPQPTKNEAAAPTSPPSPVPSPSTPSPNPHKGAPVIVVPGPGGTLIASDDLEALDELEELLTTVGGRSASSDREFAIYYLKYSKAVTIAETLGSIFGASTGGKDRGLLGDMASNALGDVGGGLMGDLLLGGAGGGGGSFASANVEIVPDTRLNALIVQGKAAELDTIEQLLKVLDQRTGPENVEADGQPRSIPVYNRSASDIAATVQTLYQDRIAGGSGQMSPQEMMKMIRGGNNAEQQVQKMSIAVDTKKNALVVRAPDPLFEEVKLLVSELDNAEADSPETTRVVSLKHTNSEAVQKALNSILGNVTTSTVATIPSSTPGGGDNNESPEERARSSMRRNWEMMQEMRRMQERMGGDRGGDSGGFDRSRFFGGRGGPGGPGGSDSSRGRGGDSGGDRGRGGDDGRRGRN